jgi:hypothetical protein
MILLETRIYINEFRWYIRFVVIYMMVGEAAMFNLVLSVRQYYSSRYTTSVASTFLMGPFLVRPNFFVILALQYWLTLISFFLCSSIFYLYCSEIVCQVCIFISIMCPMATTNMQSGLICKRESDVPGSLDYDPTIVSHLTLKPFHHQLV